MLGDSACAGRFLGAGDEAFWVACGWVVGYGLPMEFCRAVEDVGEDR